MPGVNVSTQGHLEGPAVVCFLAILCKKKVEQLVQETKKTVTARSDEEHEECVRLEDTIMHLPSTFTIEGAH